MIRSHGAWRIWVGKLVGGQGATFDYDLCVTHQGPKGLCLAVFHYPEVEMKDERTLGMDLILHSLTSFMGLAAEMFILKENQSHRSSRSFLWSIFSSGLLKFFESSHEICSLVTPQLADGTKTTYRSSQDIDEGPSLKVVLRCMALEAMLVKK